MTISVDLRDLDPMHYITAERVKSLRLIHDRLVQEARQDNALALAVAEEMGDLRVLLMALEQMTGLAQ